MTMIEKFKFKVKRFADALSFVLYDCELELRNEKLIYYMDTNVVFPMIMGFESESRGEQYTDDQRLVRSLLSCGYLGPFYMLRPHVLELNKILEHLTIPSDESAQEILRGKAHDFLMSKGIWRILSQLHNIAMGKNNFENYNEEHRVRLFIEKLQDIAGDTFAYIEQINGTWWQRLKRYKDERLLCLEKLGPEFNELINSSHSIVGDINRILRDSRPEQNLSINVFQDAAALTILHNFIRERDEKQSGPIVRFYTLTKHMCNDIMKKPELKQFLSYRKPLIEGVDRPNGAELILRDTSYFIMRAWFSYLVPGATVVEPSTLESLKLISKKLNALLYPDKKDLEDIPDEEIGEAIEKIEIEKIGHDEKNLSELIEKFEKLTIMDSIWGEGHISENFKNLKTLAKWTEVFEFAEDTAITRVLFEEIQDVRIELEKKVSLIKNWKDSFELILRKSYTTRERVKGQILDLMLDLGLVRWGYSLEHDEKQLLMEKLKGLLQDDAIEMSLSAAEVAVLMGEARLNPRKCLVVCGILWALGLFREIVAMVEDYKIHSRDQNITPSFQVIQAAAEGRTGDLTSSKRKEIVDSVLKLEEKLGEGERIGVLLGIGYVLYHAWKWENIDDDIAPYSGGGEKEAVKRKEKVKKLAQKCFALGEEAARKIPKHELAWAFSINHCSYVGIVTEIEPEKTEKYFQTLFKLENTTRWNFRFDDTVGTYYYLKAKRIWERTNKEKRKNLNLSRLIDLAEDYFRKAIEGNIGDIDAILHLNQLNTFRIEYEQFKETADQ
jgi:hypothetical protein